MPPSDSTPIARDVSEPGKRRILFFDGECPFCNGWVLFLLRHDQSKTLYAARLGGNLAAQLLGPGSVSGAAAGSVVYHESGRRLERSDAILAAARNLRWPWRVLCLSRFVPRRIRDAVYDWVARRRYMLAGSKKQCPIPPEWLRSRLLDP